MKTVFPNQELAHAYLNQTDAELDGLRSGRGSSLSFVGPTLSSYATQICRIYRNKEGARLVLMDSHSFSPSTSKHQCYLRRALRPSDLNMSAPFGSRGQYMPREGKAVWEAVKAAALSYVEQASKARARGPGLLATAQAYIADAEQVRVFFKLRNKPFAPDLSALAESMKEATKKAAAAEAKREEKKARTVAKYGPQLLALWRQHEEGGILWHDIQNAARAAGLNSLPIGPLVSTPDFAANALLRLSADRSRVETSQGAQVLTRTVRFLWAFCADAKAKGVPVDPATLRRFPRLDNYSANSIDAGGNLVAGCHRIPFAEIYRIASALDLPPFNGEPMPTPAIPAEEVTA